MAQAGERRIHRADHQFDAAPFEREHFGVAKRLRDYRVTRIQITEPHLFCRLCLFLSPVCKGHKGQRDKNDSGKPNVFPGIHLEIEHQRIVGIRLDHFLHELHKDRVFAKNRVFIHGLKIHGDKEWPIHFRLNSLAAFDAEGLGNFEELHPGVHHHLFYPRGGDLRLQFVENDMVNHEGKANRRFQRRVQAQSVIE